MWWRERRNWTNKRTNEWTAPSGKRSEQRTTISDFVRWCSFFPFLHAVNPSCIIDVLSVHGHFSYWLCNFYLFTCIAVAFVGAWYLCYHHSMSVYVRISRAVQRLVCAGRGWKRKRVFLRLSVVQNALTLRQCPSRQCPKNYGMNEWILSDQSSFCRCDDGGRLSSTDLSKAFSSALTRSFAHILTCHLLGFPSSGSRAALMVDVMWLM